MEMKKEKFEKNFSNKKENENIKVKVPKKTKRSNDKEKINKDKISKEVVTKSQTDTTSVIETKDNAPIQKLSKEEIKRIRKLKKSKNFNINNAKRLSPDIKKGLTNEEVNERVQDGYINYLETNTTKSYKSIFISNIFTFFNLLCFLIAGALMAVGSFDNLFFLFILVCNVMIGIIQEIKAKKTVEKITLVTSPTAKVIRNGKPLEIKTNEIVLDDILIFEFGNQISTDSIILKGEIEVNESLLTGESVSVKKKKGDLILAGSYVTSGSCVAKAEKIAEENYSSKLTIKAKRYKKPESELLRSLKIIIKVIGIIIVPLAILIFLNNRAILGNDIKLLVTKSAGSVIGMIPAGLFLLTSLALAVGVIKLAKKKTLVQDLYGIEMLSRASVLCLDKTGTITDGTMQVKQIKMLKKEDDLNKIMSSYLCSMKTQNQTFSALKNYFGEQLCFESGKIMEFNSSKKYSAVELKNGKTYYLGAPEFVYKTKDKKFNNLVDNYAKEGYRVLVLCESIQKIDKTLPKDLVPICLLNIEEKIRKEAKETIAWFNANGVQIKIISGDNPLTVSEISKKVGVVDSDKYISLEGMTKQQVIECAKEYSIFGRVSPEQKQILVKALKNLGHKVAMTGDGVNDILALKEADCSISVASGSEAARNVSHLVLLDSNFLNLPRVVEEGRRVVNNIVNSASLFLMKTFFTFVLTIFCLIMGINYPFTPNQVILLEFFTIGVPSFFLALQPNNKKINGTFISKVASKSLFYGSLLFLTFISCYLFDQQYIGGTYETMASISICFVGLVILLKICTPLNLYRGILWLSMTIGTILALIILPASFFSYIPLSLTNYLYIIINILASFVLVFSPLMFQKRKDIPPSIKKDN